MKVIRYLALGSLLHQNNVSKSQEVDPYSPISEDQLVKMVNFGGDQVHFRVLDCQMCFKAEGRMCYPENYQHNLNAVRTGKTGMGICCKPGSTDQECEQASGQTGQVCSMKSMDTD